MKQGIHPVYHEKAVVRCACGNEFVTGSTRESITVETCAQCHPFYTGELRRAISERGGRLERFRKKYNWDQ